MISLENLQFYSQGMVVSSKPTRIISAVIHFEAGLQPDLCIKVYPPTPILTMALNPSAGLLALGKYCLNKRKNRLFGMSLLMFLSPLTIIFFSPFFKERLGLGGPRDDSM